MNMMNQLQEAEQREFMTKREEKLKRKLIALLRDDGRGHKHAKFAERLNDFIVKIVDRKDDPNMTAAVSWNDATIYISDGFLENPATFYQLNVLMRHELAHYLMQHEMRMMHKIIAKYGETAYKHLAKSKSLHEILNIIEDFEISNKRYTAEDKQLVRNLFLGGKLISGLVTEDSRAAWAKLPVEQMYDELSNEIEQIQSDILSNWDAQDRLNLANDRDFISNSVKNNLYSYVNTERPTNFFGTIEKFLADNALYHFAIFDTQNRPCIVKRSSLPDEYPEIAENIYDEITGKDRFGGGYTKQEVRDLITGIAKSAPTKQHDLVNPRVGHIFSILYTPEEKFFAIDVLKALLPELEPYDTWYHKVQKTLSDKKYTQADLANILKEIDK